MIELIEPRMATQNIVCHLNEYEDYEVSDLDHYGKCIMGVNLINSTKTMISDMRGLSELLNLYESIQIVEKDDASVTKLLINWLKKNGMPVHQGRYSRMVVDNRQFGYSIKFLKESLSEVYESYLLCIRLYYENVDRTNRFYSLASEVCINRMNELMVTTEISIVFKFANAGASLLYECPDLFNTAKTQIYLMSLKANSQNIGICERCAKPYEKKRKNNTLCPECQRRKYQWSRDQKKLFK